MKCGCVMDAKVCSGLYADANADADAEADVYVTMNATLKGNLERTRFLLLFRVHAQRKPSQRMLKVWIIDPTRPQRWFLLCHTTFANVVQRKSSWLRSKLRQSLILLSLLFFLFLAEEGENMARPRDHPKTFLVLWCVLSTAFSMPNSTPSMDKMMIEQLYTTRRTPKVVVDLPVAKSRLPLPVENFELKSTTTLSSESSSTTTTTHRSFSTEQPLYRLDGSNGQACILLQVDALITVKYRTKTGEDQEANIYVPNDATVTGNCDNENTVTMSLKWKAFVLSWSFAKTPGGERWYVEKIELTYNSSDRHFEHIDQPNKTIRLSTGQKHSSMLFPTPVGKSYACDDETEIPLTDGKNHATVLLRDMKLQPFKFKNNEFAAEFSCTSLSARGFRDETAPVAVGSTLAAAVLLTITGYAAYRYFKVKKVKYDTME